MQPSWLRYTAMAAGTAFLGYCVYFDYKRRHDREFRRAIRTSLTAAESVILTVAFRIFSLFCPTFFCILGQSYIDENASIEREAAAQLEEALSRAVPFEQQERLRFLQEEIMLGSEAIKEGPYSYPKAAACFYNAVRACPQQNISQLLQELQSELPGEVFMLLMQLFKQETMMMQNRQSAMPTSSARIDEVMD